MMNHRSDADSAHDIRHSILMYVYGAEYYSSATSTIYTLEEIKENGSMVETREYYSSK